MLLVISVVCLAPTVAVAGDQPVQLMLLTDAHKSAQSYELGEVASKLLTGIQDSPAATGSGIGWVSVSKSTAILLPFTAVSNLKSKALSDARGSYNANAQRRAINPALERAIDELSKHQGHRAIILFLADQQSGESALDSEVSRRLADQKITVHAVALGKNADRTLLRQMAEESDGVHYGIDSHGNMETVVSRVMANLDRGRRGRPMIQWVTPIGADSGSDSNGKGGGMGIWGWLFVVSWGLVAVFVLFRFYHLSRLKPEKEEEFLDDPPPSEPHFDPAHYFEGQKDGPAGSGIKQYRFVSKEEGFASFESSADGRDITIGRRKSSDVYLDHEGCSGRHALIRWDNSALLVVDRGSTNGTFVNDVRVTEQALFDGDLVRFDSIAFLVEAVSSAAQDSPISDPESPHAGTMMLAADDPELQRLISASQAEQQVEENSEPSAAPPIELHHAQCLRHSNRLATGHCAECNRPYCPDCLEYVLDREICVRCRNVATNS
jgi:hypothetical protein